MDQRGGPGQRIFPLTWLQARENPPFPDSVYQDRRTITDPFRRKQTFLSHPRSNSSKREMAASLDKCFFFWTNTFLKSLVNFGRPEHLETLYSSFPGGASGKGPICQCRGQKEMQVPSLCGNIPWRRAWQPTLVFLPGESHGQRNLMGYSPRSAKSHTQLK